ncbi:ribonuclease HIII [Candidatus Marinamargulisbacteria bacterium SCGC AG-343-D04]|nr:ribonuclease HIII [Candidatus Marinamargulisbacteria bacterium SCGC AG-343-D04]
MIHASDKIDLYRKVKHKLQADYFVVNPYRLINYGLQFLVFLDNHSELLRIFESKKGIRIDFSQVKNEAFLHKIQSCLEDDLDQVQVTKPLFDPDEKDVESLNSSFQDPDDLIGIDESGKGDYFGPLVVAAVRVHPEILPQFEGLGIADSKTLTDSSITKVAPKIMEIAPHAVLVMNNQSYNEIYDKFQNLNHILSWGHMKVLEDTLKQGHCEHALSDQFASASVLKNSLRAKKIDVKLMQRPRAESNFSVACASILARYHFITQIDKVSAHYKMKLPKGSGKNVVQAAQTFIETHGKKELHLVAKLHFKITKMLKDVD